jgi:dimethylaniline monooxygenase (N-oxide forming)
LVSVYKINNQSNKGQSILAEYSKYLYEYAVHFNLLSYIRFDHEVQQIKQVTERWAVQIKRRTGDSEWYEEIFDRVAICSGTHQKRAMPTLIGLERFQGKIKHMQDIQIFEEFKGKRICILGSGESGSELALAASKYGERTFVSIRRDHGYLVSRYPFGLDEPSDLQTTRVRYSIPIIFGYFQVIIRFCFEKVSVTTRYQQVCFIFVLALSLV